MDSSPLQAAYYCPLHSRPHSDAPCAPPPQEYTYTYNVPVMNSCQQLQQHIYAGSQYPPLMSVSGNGLRLGSSALHPPPMPAEGDKIPGKSPPPHPQQNTHLYPRSITELNSVNFASYTQSHPTCMQPELQKFDESRTLQLSSNWLISSIQAEADAFGGAEPDA